VKPGRCAMGRAVGGLSSSKVLFKKSRVAMGAIARLSSGTRSGVSPGRCLGMNCLELCLLCLVDAVLKPLDDPVVGVCSFPCGTGGIEEVAGCWSRLRPPNPIADFDLLNTLAHPFLSDLGFDSFVDIFAGAC